MTLSGSAFANNTSADKSGQAGGGKADPQAAAASRCNRLVGSEKDLCMRQARESSGAPDRNGAGAASDGGSGQ